eukprot:1938118-Pyramimonas_sp.AAC.1
MENRRASMTGHDRAVKALLEGGARPDQAAAAGTTALMHAAAGGHEGAVQLLLEAGECVVVASSVWTTMATLGYGNLASTYMGTGPFASELRYCDVNRLGSKRASPDCADAQGDTALTAAAVGHHEGTILALLEWGANARTAVVGVSSERAAEVLAAVAEAEAMATGSSGKVTSKDDRYVGQRDVMFDMQGRGRVMFDMLGR